MTREEEAIKQLEDLREHCSAMINNTCIGGENIWRKDVEALDMAIKALEQEPKTGHWQKISADKYSEHVAYYFRCSECGKDIIGEHNYCPNCGCRMKGGE